MNKLYRWRKDGDWEVYEGEYAIAVGYDNKYDCFGRKDGDRTTKSKVRWDDTGLYSNPNSNVLIGQYSKDKAKSIIDKIDSALVSDKELYIEANSKSIPSQTITLKSKDKGVVVIYRKGGIDDRLHEEGHIKAGMYRTSRSYHYNDELPAVRFQIEELNKRGLWNKKIRNKVVGNLATYSKIPYQKKRRAIKSIKKIEAKLGIVR
jgi:hypothetical protein